MALGKTSRGFAHAKKFKAEGSSPIIERRLLKPGLAVKARRHPIAGFGHIAGDPCVARLIWADEAERAEMVEVAEVQCGENENGPARRAVPERLDAAMCQRHGKSSLVCVTEGESLALKVIFVKTRNGQSLSYWSRKWPLHGNFTRSRMKEWLQYAVAWASVKTLGVLPRGDGAGARGGDASGCCCCCCRS